MRIDQAKALPIVAIMDALGHQPVKVHKGKQEWLYRSPIREEKDGSFGVNTVRNVFYDLGTGQGGNIIDFAKLMARSDSVSDALRWLDRFAHVQPMAEAQFQKSATEYKIRVDRVQPLQDPKLQQYLTETRQLSLSACEPHVCEVHYHNGRKGPFYAVGFANDSQGYELRTHGFKGSTSKDITLLKTLSGQARDIHVFEGFTDYLSLLTLTDRHKLKTDVLVLNGTAMAERASATLKTGSYARIFTWLDNGKGGERLTQSLSQAFPQAVYPMNGLFAPHDDVNAFLKAQRQEHSLAEVQQQFTRQSGTYANRSPYQFAEVREGQGHSR